MVDIITDLINNQPDWFEDLVLTRIVRDPEFYTKVSSILCVDPITGRDMEDFNGPTRNHVYTILKRYYQCVGVKSNRPIDSAFAEAIINQMFSKEQTILEQEIPNIVSKLNQLLEKDVRTTIDPVNKGFSYWLKKNRISYIIDKHSHMTTWTAEDLQAKIRLFTDAVNIVDRGEYIYKFGHGVENHMLDVVRLRTGLSRFDTAMGGGFGRGESNLLMGSTGGGKTIIACQLGARFSLDGSKGIFITTEQGHEELEPRIISNFCGVPFNRIKDKVDLNLFQPQERAKYEELKEVLEQRLSFVEWKADRGLSVTDDLDNELKRYQDKHGGIDFVILDWIGGALGSAFKGKEEFRHILQSAADKLCEIAASHKIVTIGLAQLNPKQAINKKNPDMTMLQECKTMGNNMSYIIGITSLLDTNAMKMAGDEGPLTWSEKQYLYISKGRKSQGGAALFRRRYEFQRMENF